METEQHLYFVLDTMFASHLSIGPKDWLDRISNRVELFPSYVNGALIFSIIMSPSWKLCEV